MEPLGTITVYFPFIDSETRGILEKIMGDAANYYDFVKTLQQMVLDSDCSDKVVYFALHHSAQLLDFKAINEIGRKYSDYQLLMPPLFFASAYQGHPEDFEAVRKSANLILSRNPPNWIAIEMHFWKFETESWNYPKTLYDEENLKTIKKMIEKEPRFGFYEALLQTHFASRAHIDGDSMERRNCIDHAIRISREYDDKVRLAYNLRVKANILENENRVEAREHLLESGRLMKLIGSKEGYSHVLENISKLEAIRGEFNYAIEHYLETVSIRESLGIETGNISLVLSALYNIMGEFESGLEWAQMAEDQYKTRPKHIPRAILNQVWSLIALGRIAEANLLLDTVQEPIIKSGQETHLAWLHFINGLIEYNEGDFVSASSSIEEALKIYETRDGTMMIQLLFLYHLAKIEISQSEIDTEVYPYLALLEEKSISEDLPGIMGQTLLLKAELALFKNDDSLLRDIVQKLNSLTQEPSMEFLVPPLKLLLTRI